MFDSGAFFIVIHIYHFFYFFITIYDSYFGTKLLKYEFLYDILSLYDYVGLYALIVYKQKSYIQMIFILLKYDFKGIRKNYGFNY